MKKTIANKEIIERLLTDETVKKSDVAKETSIPANTLSNYSMGIISIDKMRLEYAVALTEYAKKYYKKKG